MAEALRLGAPVIVLDHGGAGTLARSAPDQSRVSLIPDDLGAEDTVRAMAAAMEHHHGAPNRARDPQIDRERSTAVLASLMREAMADNAAE